MVCWKIYLKRTDNRINTEDIGETVKTLSFVFVTLLVSLSFEMGLLHLAGASEAPYRDIATASDESKSLRADAESSGSTPTQVSPAPVLKNTEQAQDPGIDSTGGHQKETCATQLKHLRELFIKTRHYAVQRAPCDTAESGAAFLRIIEKCRQDCPPQFLEQNGYTSRIIRHMTSLHKIGEGRCRDGREATPPQAGGPEPLVVPSVPQDPN